MPSHDPAALQLIARHRRLELAWRRALLTAGLTLAPITAVALLLAY